MISKLILISLFVFNLLYPLIIWPKIQPMRWPKGSWFEPWGQVNDFFFAYKAYTCMFFGVFLGALFLCYLVFRDHLSGDRLPRGVRVRKFFRENYLKPSATSLFVLALYTSLWLSVVINPFKSLTLWGVPGMWEGAIVQTSYALIFFACYALSHTQKIQLHYSFAVVGIILGGVGIVELAYKSPVLWPLTQYIFTGGLDYDTGYLSVIRRGDVNTMSLTFGNPNYVGQYAALVVPLTFWGVLFEFFVGSAVGSVRTLRVRIILAFRKIIWILAHFSAVVILIGSGNRGGFVGASLGLLALVTILLVRFLRRGSNSVRGSFKRDTSGLRTKKKLGALTLTLILIYLSAAFTLQIIRPGPYKRLDTITGETLSFVFGDSKSESHTRRNIIKHSFNHLSVKLNEFNLHFYIKNRQVRLFDDYNKEFSLRLIGRETSRYQLLSLSSAVTYDTSSVVIELMDGLPDRVGSIIFKLWYKGSMLLAVAFNQENGIGIFERNYLFSPKISQNMELFPPRVFSRRGYIWNHTIPLLKETLVLGKGPGRFILDFPQADYSAKLAAGISLSATVDRPHNMYLQKTHAQGILGTLAFLGLVGIILWQNIKILFEQRNMGRDNDPPHGASYVAGGIAGIIGYLVCGLVTDTTVQTEPAFWLLLGLLGAHSLPVKNKAIASGEV